MGSIYIYIYYIKGLADKTRQGNTREHKKRLENTRKYKTKRSKTRQDKTRKHKTRQENTRQHNLFEFSKTLIELAHHIVERLAVSVRLRLGFRV